MLAQTLLTALVCFWMATQVARAHQRVGILAPVMVGDPVLERTIRAHLNTLEWMPMFLVPLWLCAIYLSDVAAAALGLVWVVGRALYFTGYSQAVEKRLPGFFIQASGCILLFVGALVGIVMHW